MMAMSAPGRFFVRATRGKHLRAQFAASHDVIAWVGSATAAAGLADQDPSRAAPAEFRTGGLEEGDACLPRWPLPTSVAVDATSP